MEWRNYKKVEENWPPVLNTCPDYWMESSDGLTCVNTKGVGDLPRNSSTKALVRGKTTRKHIKDACLWSIRNGTPWEGVDNKC